MKLPLLWSLLLLMAQSVSISGVDAFTDFRSPRVTSRMNGMARERLPEPPVDDDRFAELEAMGGDPFFLSEDEDHKVGSKQDSTSSEEVEDSSRGPTSLSSDFMTASTALSPKSPVSRFVTDGLGPSPSQKSEKESGEKSDVDSHEDSSDWEWDGVVNEDAHLDLDDW